MAADDGREPGRSGIAAFLAQHPVFTLICGLSSVVSLPLAVYFYRRSHRSRDLSVYVDPTKSIILKSGQSSELHVSYGGKEIATDVTAIQVTIWNRGKESIRPEHVLEPVVIQTTGNVAVLESRVRHVSRPLIRAELDERHAAEGRVGVSWKILEGNDGLLMQLILAGPTTTSVTATGSFEGQPGIKVFETTQQAWLSWFKGIFGLAVMMIIGVLAPIKFRGGRCALTCWECC